MLDYISHTGGEKMVYAEKHELGQKAPYLKPALVKEGVTSVKIKDEFVYVETEFEGKPTGKKLQGHCTTNKDEPSEITWTMNPTTANYMIDKHGSDTEKWIGTTVELAVKKAGSASPGVYPKDCSLETVIA